MIEPSKEASQRQRRANWVGLRTLRQRPKLVGATDDGEPIYEVRAVRLVLLGTSPNFSRLVPCSRCGRELPGAPVLMPSDLDIELRPMICADCIRGTGITSVWDPEAARRAARGQEGEAEGGTDLGPSTPVKQEALSPRPDGAPPVAAPATPDAGVAAGDRLAAMERHLVAVTARVNDLGRRGAAQQTQSDERRRREAEAAAARDAAVDRALAEIRAELGSSLAAGRTADERALEDRLTERLAEIRAELGLSLAADIRALEDRLTDRLTEIRAQLGSALAADIGAIEHRFNERVAQSRAEPVPSVAGDGDAGARALEDRLSEASAGLAELVAAQRAELAAVVAKVAEMGSEVHRLSQTAAELARGQGVLERRVAEAPRPPAPAIPLVDVEAVTAPPPAKAAARSGSLLESLERQLEAAADRLAARSDLEPDH